MITLTMKDQRRLKVVQMVMDGRIEVLAGGSFIGIGKRQMYRLLSSVRKRGVAGAIHGNRGNRYALKYDDDFKSKILVVVGKYYQDINDTHLREILFRDKNIQIGKESLRILLRSAGIKPKRKRRKRKYRSRRERKESMGMMIQIDASEHDWFEGRGPIVTTLGGVDDATGFVWARFEVSETIWGYLHLMRQIVVSHGIPYSIYSDRHTIFHSPKQPTIIEQLQNTRSKTQFGRAMDELGIEQIKAYSPQAKGRIERLWNTFQDRLIVEMRLAGISSIQDANNFLADFLVQYNGKFSVPPKNIKRQFRKRPTIKALDRMLCLKETRIVNKDHTISFEGVVLQIPPSSKWASIAGQKVQVLQLKDGSVEILYKNLTVAKFLPVAVERIAKRCLSNNNQLLLAA